MRLVCPWQRLLKGRREVAERSRLHFQLHLSTLQPPFPCKQRNVLKSFVTYIFILCISKVDVFWEGHRMLIIIRLFCTYLLCNTLTTFEVYFWISLQNLPNPSVKLWSFQWSIRADKWQTKTKLNYVLINFQSKRPEIKTRMKGIGTKIASNMLSRLCIMHQSGVYGKFEQQKTDHNLQILKK